MNWKKGEFDVKAVVVLIVGGILAIYFLGSILPGASNTLLAANYSQVPNNASDLTAGYKAGTGNTIAQAIIVLVVPVFIAVVILKLFGYI